MAMGVGPLIFAWVFRMFSRSDSHWPLFPGAPFVLGSVVSVAALLLAMTLPASHVHDDGDGSGGGGHEGVGCGGSGEDHVVGGQGGGEGRHERGEGAERHGLLAGGER